MNTMSMTKGECWDGGHQGTLLQLPVCVDRGWVQKQMRLVPSDIRLLHNWRQEIRDLSGFPWPVERPTEESLPDVLLAALAYPSFVRVATRILARNDSKPKRWKATLFTRLKSNYPASHPDGPPPKAPPGKGKPRFPNHRHVLASIREEGDAEAYIVSCILLRLLPEDALERFLDIHAKDSTLAEFATSAGALLDDGFDWVQDVIEQPRAPRQPPAPRDEIDLVPALPLKPTPEASVEVSEPESVSSTKAEQEPQPVQCDATEEVPQGVAPPAIEVAVVGLPEDASVAPVSAASKMIGDSAQTPVEAALAKWRDAMSRIMSAANSTLGADPELLSIASIEAATRAARDAAVEWEAALPKLVDAKPVFAALRSLLRDVRALPDAPGEADPASIGEFACVVDESVMAEAQGEAERGRAMLTQAGARVDAAEAVFRSVDISTAATGTMTEAFAELTAARAARVPAMRDLVNLCTAVAAMLRSASEAAAAKPDAAIHPTDRLTESVLEATPETNEEEATSVSEPISIPEAACEQDGQAESVAERPPSSGPFMDDIPPSSEAAPAPEPMQDEDPFFDHDEAPEELPMLAQTASLPLATAAAATMPAAEKEPVDPLVCMVVERIERYFAAGDFALAYHLTRAARRVFLAVKLPFSLPELRLAAMRGHVSHASMQGNPMLSTLVADATDAVAKGTLADEGGDASQARRMALVASLLDLAMFNQGHPAADGLRLIQDVSPEMGDGFHDLMDALTHAGLRGFVLPQHFLAVQAEALSTRQVDECADRIRESITAFEGIRFTYVPANVIRNELARRERLIGRLKAAVTGEMAESLPAAREFVEICSDRDAIIEAVNNADGMADKVGGLTGFARNRMASAIEEIASSCKEYVAAAEALPLARDNARNAHLKMTAQKIVSGSKAALRALAAHMEVAGPLTKAAIGHAEAAILALVQSVQGRHHNPGPHDYQLAVHGPLYWLPGLTFGQGWLPAPYNPENLIGVLNEHDGAPRLGVDAWRVAVDRALRDGSLIAAQLLIDAAAFHGIPPEARKQAQDAYNDTLTNSRQSLLGAGEEMGEIERVRRLIEKVQRMGRFSRVDQAQAEMVRLDRISPDRLPSLVSLEERGEEEDNDQILDIRAARDLLADVEQRIAHALEVPKRELFDELKRLEKSGALPDDVDRIQRIMEADDLLTAGELISFLKAGSALPVSTSPNPRYKAYIQEVPAAVANLGKRALDEACTAIRERSDLVGLPFSRVMPDRTEDALEIAQCWRELRVVAELGKDKAESAVPKIAAFLSKAGIEADILEVLPPGKSGSSRKTYSADMKLRIPDESDSLLLPDFGSSTGGLYRISLVPQVQTEHEMKALRDATPDNYGLIVLVMQAVDTERRMQLAGAAIESKRRALVIDESILLYALSEPSFRPLTMFELAQPSSFASPYISPGSGAVPPEMFFGREDEISKIAERDGSCIVYGGRRLGKTALLHRVRQLYHKADGTGAVVAYADIRNVGGTELTTKLWEHASRAMPEIFPSQVQTANQFTETIRRWLADDTRRRVLLLLDETDDFIQSDAKKHYEVFVVLRNLMDDMQRRFKFVLAGLKNVSRLARTDNPPLKHIAASPIRIGPLMDAELIKAEDMVIRPLAAMGYEFESRSEVWRILSHCNYYPILVQAFCAGLQVIISKGTSANRKSERKITSRQVLEALENATIVKEIRAKFDHTLHEIDARYGLIAFVVAHRSLEDQELGRADEGMTTTQLYDHARTWWGPAFESLEGFKDLLDEMEGMGVLRVTAAGAWTLRSHTLLRLLGNREELEHQLLEFEKRDPPSAFDPRSMRRELREMPRFRDVQDGHHSPLSLGQEHNLFQGAETVSVVFGSVLSDVHLVVAALSSADHVHPKEGSAIAVLPRIFTECGDLLDAIRIAGRSGSYSLIVVDPKSRWDANWIGKVTANRLVREGRVRIAFVGGPDHALAWLSDPRTQRLAPQVSVIGLSPWSNAMTSGQLVEDGLAAQPLAGELAESLGGFNGPMTRAFYTKANGNRDRFARVAAKIADGLHKSGTLAQDIGLIPQVAECFGAIERLDVIDAKGTFKLKNANAALSLDDTLCSLPLERLIDYGTFMGFLRMEPLSPNGDPGDRVYRIVALARTALASARVMEPA
jgi:hypothetical protein